MTLSRKKFWIVLQLFILLLAAVYQLMWLVAGVETKGYILGFSEGTRDFPVKEMFVEYNVNGRIHVATFLSDHDIPFHTRGKEIDISYLSFARGSARLPMFTPGDAVALMSYGLILFVSALVFLMPNYFIGRRSYFVISRKFPFARYYSGKVVTHKETMSLIARANLFAGYIEKFMLPFAASGLAALILYLITWSVTVVIICFITGSVFGVIRAIKWKRSLEPGDDELEVLDVLPDMEDAQKRRPYS